MQDLRKRIEADIKKDANIKPRQGIFEVFPNAFHKKKLEKYERKEKTVAAKFVELLVASNLGYKSLQSKYGKMNENALFTEIKNSLKYGLRPGVLETSNDLIESCIITTINFFKIKEIPMRIKDEPRVKSESCSDVSISPEHSSR